MESYRQNMKEKSQTPCEVTPVQLHNSPSHSFSGGPFDFFLHSDMCITERMIHKVKNRKIRIVMTNFQKTKSDTKSLGRIYLNVTGLHLNYK